MDFDEVGRVWRSEASGEVLRTSVEQLSTVRARCAQIDGNIRRRDRLEIAVCLFMLPVFALLAIRAPSLLSALGAGIVALGLGIIPLRLRSARRSAPERSLPVRAALEAEASRLSAQERLLGSVALWYFGPLLVGVLLFVYGLPAPLGNKVGFTLLTLAFGGFGVWVNSRTQHLQLRPVRRQLEGWLADLRDSDLEGMPHED